jgi:hypothetical protein
VTRRVHVAWAAARVALVLVGTPPLARAQQRYEAPPVFSAVELLAPPLLKSALHEVDQEVPSDGYWYAFTVTSLLGTFPATGSTQLSVRVQEVGALAELKSVNEAAVAAGALADSAIHLAKGVANVATRPEETAKGAKDGAKRLVGRLGRKARRTAEKGRQALAGGKEASGEEDKDLSDKVGDASVSLAKSLFGVTKAYRAWARRLGVDPYTTNEILRKELQHVAVFDAAGRFATKLAPLGVVGTVAGTVATANDIVWSKEPDELETWIEGRLVALGVSPEGSRDFRLNRHLGLTRQTRLISALDVLPNVPGRAGFVAQAADADQEIWAEFYTQSAELLASFHQGEARIRQILPGTLDAAALVGEGSDRLVHLLPVDCLSWTIDVAEDVERSTAQAMAEFPGARREIWLTGRATERARREMRARGWVVREGVLASGGSP